MTDYFCDLDAGSSGDGSFASPWNSPEDVEGGGLGTGDSVYFKCGTSYSYSGTGGFSINWSGTSSSVRSHVGAYYDDGGSPETDYETVKSQITLDVEDYAEIDGPWTDSWCGSPWYNGLINVNDNEHYLYIENIRCVNSTAYGLTVDCWGPVEGFTDQ
jgi:hypothetical protein